MSKEADRLRDASVGSTSLDKDALDGLKMSSTAKDKFRGCTRDMGKCFMLIQHELQMDSTNPNNHWRLEYYPRANQYSLEFQDEETWHDDPMVGLCEMMLRAKERRSTS